MMPAGANQGGGDVEDYDRVFRKLGAMWKCQNDQCKRIWGSTNSWDDELESGIRNACNACGMKGKLVGLKDKILLINIYRCYDGNGKTCSSWQERTKENDPGKESPCQKCGCLVAPIGPPKEREGRIYDFECRNRACKSFEWDDYFVGKLMYQKCKVCDTEGRVIGMIPKKKEKFVFLTPHDAKRCDMCISMRKQEKGSNCTAMNKICCKEEFPESRLKIHFEKIV